jgi:hypothetical protein
MDGLMVGCPQDLLFDCNCPYTGCRVCGVVFQSEFDRAVGDLAHNLTAISLRKAWSINHAKEHTNKEHLDLARSGCWATPIAAARLASYGIVALSDMVMNPEVEDALANARSIPINDAEGRTSVL